MVTVNQASEMQWGHEIMPIEKVFASNPTIAGALTLGMQSHLNTSIPTDDDPYQPHPVLTSRGRFSSSG
jgi:hypothetical protein